MLKFVKIEGYNDFKKMVEYIKENTHQNYYITPKLMNSFINSNCPCIIGVKADDIKICDDNKIQLAVMSVYNKVFENDAFRIEAVKLYDSLHSVRNELDYETVIFGLEEDEKYFTCYKVLN